MIYELQFLRTKAQYANSERLHILTRNGKYWSLEHVYPSCVNVGDYVLMRGKWRRVVGTGRFDEPIIRNWCEWNPIEHCIAESWQRHAEATVSVGRGGKFKLCESCASLPLFKRFKVRKKIPQIVGAIQ